MCIIVITKPQDFENPRLILFNSDLANELNLNVNSNEEEICDFLLGKKNKEKNFFLRHMLVINLVTLLF